MKAKIHFMPSLSLSQKHYSVFADSKVLEKSETFIGKQNKNANWATLKLDLAKKRKCNEKMNMFLEEQQLSLMYIISFNQTMLTQTVK